MSKGILRIMLTVLMSMYNSGRYLREAIERLVPDVNPWIA